MSGIRHGSRLEHLLQLRARIDDEIATERVLQRRHERALAQRLTDADAARRQARRESVSAATVRAWADKYGHPHPPRGRIPDQLVDLYLDAHTTGATA